MDTNSKSMCPKARTEDRISALPDAIICHILSFLPTSDAVTTCFLSNRWKNMWTLVPTVELIVLSTAWDSGGTAAYVDRYLLFRGSSNIHKFHLCCVDLDGIVGRINGWICTALRRNVVELHLEFDERDDSHEFLVLPQDLFVCKTLETLKLSLGEHVTAVAPPTSNCFPRLKSLHITFDFPKYVEQIEKLFSCCPALEDLVVDGDLGWLEENQVLNVTISAPKLKRLKIYLFAHAMTLGENKIFVNADVPSLEDLDLTENFLASYCLKGAKSLTNAKIDFSVMREEDEGHPADVLADVDRVQRLFAEISNVKHLSLVVPVLGDTYIEYQCSLPTFNHLNQLELNHLECCSWKSLTNMLKITPNLENLLFAVNVKCDAAHDEDELKHKWSPPELVPVCLSSCLKTICISGFKGGSDEMEMVEYLLEHGQLLNELKVLTFDMEFDDALEVLMEIILFPRASNTCEIQCFN
ncbi:unnamed protein product [Prunus armeniaca]|uniref:F-box domain-containing protein n=1 Tax=Prunus armeniaca TaxID=36596 RepID=A0A6J5UMW2_PRUAR|nr:unnamed protein product [Prunus armeniaca]